MEYTIKWVEAKALQTNMVAIIASFLYELILADFGCPLMLVSDQGTHFINDTIEHLTTPFLFKHRMSTTYYPHQHLRCTMISFQLEYSLTNFLNWMKLD
jgi:hypothetical protein